MNDWYSADWLTREKLQSIRADAERPAVHAPRTKNPRKFPAVFMTIWAYGASLLLR
jgi:hypothetical protein